MHALTFRLFAVAQCSLARAAGRSGQLDSSGAYWCLFVWPESDFCSLVVVAMEQSFDRIATWSRSLALPAIGGRKQLFWVCAVFFELFFKLNRNALKTLPTSVGNWTNLQAIELDRNPLRELPPTICHWDCLQDLGVSVFVQRRPLFKSPHHCFSVAQYSMASTNWPMEQSTANTSIWFAFFQIHVFLIFSLQWFSCCWEKLTHLDVIPILVYGVWLLFVVFLLQLGRNDLVEVPPALSQCKNLRTIAVRSVDTFCLYWLLSISWVTIV